MPVSVLSSGFNFVTSELLRVSLPDRVPAAGARGVTLAEASLVVIDWPLLLPGTGEPGSRWMTDQLLIDTAVHL